MQITQIIKSIKLNSNDRSKHFPLSLFKFSLKKGGILWRYIYMVTYNFLIPISLSKLTILKSITIITEFSEILRLQLPKDIFLILGSCS